MNGNDDLLHDSQLQINQATTEQQPALRSHRKKKCRGNRKEQHARRRLRKRDLKEQPQHHEQTQQSQYNRQW